MTKKELEMVNDEDQLIEYLGNWYEFAGMLGTHYVFSNISNGDAIALGEHTLLSDNVFFVDRREFDEERHQYLEEYYNADRI